MKRISNSWLTTLIVASLGFGSVAGAAPDAKKPPAKAPAGKKAPPEKKPVPKKIVMVSADKKKVLAENFGGFKFGMSKDDVLKVLQKQVDERFEEKIKSTEDITKKDKLRSEKKREMGDVTRSYVEFSGKNVGGWDVSIVEGEFAHKTGEAMLDRWENKDGKNQRRFFFFADGKLWKMAISLDVSILPEDKRNFETFSQVMQGKYGPGSLEGGTITWYSDEFEVRAVDKLKSYTALIIAIEEPKTKKQLIALRAEKAEKKPDTSPIIKSVIDVDGKDKPDVKANNNAIDSVINANGGKPPKK
jgi:hypothetical protein